MPSALIVEDDDPSRFALSEFTERLGYTTTTAASFEEARTELGRAHPAVVLLDMFLPGGSGIDLLLEMPSPRPHVLLMSGDCAVQQAVEQMSLHTVQFLRKPIDPASLTKVLEEVRKTAQATRVSVPHPLTGMGRLIGVSAAIEEVRRLIERVATTDFPVYLEGESGTGKELVAETLHLLSQRAGKSFVAVNCGALPDSLVDSELFGHERGAFTGALTVKQGVFEQATGGTLFLDEIAEMSIEHQVRLLRVLETGRVRRLGGTKDIPIDVRIIAATNRPMASALRTGKLREDLYHRLAVFPIELPTLRSRVEDIDMLAEHFLHESCAAEGAEKRMAPETKQALLRYHWPGNVRQLRNTIRRAFVLADRTLTVDCLLPQVRAGSDSGIGSDQPGAGGETTLASAQRRLIETTLDRRSGDKRATAEALGISLRTLYSRLREYGSPDVEGS